MRITKIGTDFITIDEDNLYDEKLKSIPKVHLIKFNFFAPTEEKVKKVIDFYPRTNRFVVDNNIRDYNSILKWTNKKYYVENTEKSKFISFFRKNNKILLNFLRLNPLEKQFILNNCFEDVLRNLEVVLIDLDIFNSNETLLRLWNGNVIIQDK